MATGSKCIGQMGKCKITTIFFCKYKMGKYRFLFKGHTGFPWIDAIMTQLREEGWIHHLARHAVACFLTRGDLWISWEEGMKVFEELLLDADWSVNAGTWMWLSCSSFFQQFFHCYCPVKFGRKADPNGDYIRKYIPALKARTYLIILICIELFKFNELFYGFYKQFKSLFSGSIEYSHKIYTRTLECSWRRSSFGQMYYR